jgi:hypothetical protein
MMILPLVYSRDNKTRYGKFCAAFDSESNMPFYLRWLVTANEVGDNSLTVSSRKAGERQYSKQLVNLLNICLSNARSHKQTN